MDIQSIKQRFGIIGNSPLLDRAIDIARQVATTDLSVLITGESGVGKEFFPQIIHQLSARKHGPYIAVNCGAIPEGTIDSELFGHEKGSFTGASDSRKGYFEVVNGGSIFLDEVAELPLSTQVRLLRVLETGEFIRVGSSKVIKTNVRVIAATNVNMNEAIGKGRFREDLFYRLNSVPIYVPALRERKEDIFLLFRKFSADFASRYRMPSVQLDENAKQLLINYRWPGNIRQLKNITEQISIIEKERNITAEILSHYLPHASDRNLPVLFADRSTANPELSERDLLYRVLFDMRKDITELKRIISEITQGNIPVSHESVLNQPVIPKPQTDTFISKAFPNDIQHFEPNNQSHFAQPLNEAFSEPVVIEESLSLQEREIEMIKKALEKHRGKRKNAAKELGISERTLYRKIKEYQIDG